MDIRISMGILWRRTWLILLVSALAGGLAAGLLLTHGAFPQYTASAIVAIGVDTPGIQDPMLVELARELIPTYVRLATMEPTAAAVIANLQLPDTTEEMAGKINAYLIGNSQLLEVQATYADPQIAAAIANEVVAQLLSQASPRVRSTMIPIQAAVAPSLPDVAALAPAVISALAAGLLVIGGIYLVEFIRNPLYGRQDVEEILQLPTLMTWHPASRANLRGRDGARSDASTWWALAEAGERHWTGNPKPKRWVALTALSPRRTPIECALQWARAWASRGEAVLLADADKSHPLPGKLAPVEADWRLLPAADFSVDQFVDQAKDASITIVRAAPVVSSIDTLALAARGVEVILIVEAGRTRVAEAQQALELLRAVDASIWGVLIVQRPSSALRLSLKGPVKWIGKTLRLSG